MVKTAKRLSGVSTKLSIKPPIYLWLENYEDYVSGKKIKRTSLKYKAFDSCRVA